MAGSTFGSSFQITTWGESHGDGLGVVIDGCPAGLELTREDIQAYLDRRKPGQNKYTTARRESDQVEILSGVFEGRTTGCPIALLIRNENQISKDYSQIQNCYRPGHADYTFDQKYGIRDYRGGGRSSGRETIGRVAAGAIASKLLAGLGIRVTAYTKAIGPFSIPAGAYDFSQISKNALFMPSSEYAEKAQDYLAECMANHDSAGGIIECQVTGLPAGIGEPVFDKLDASLAKAILSIGAVKGMEIGDGFLAAQRLGSQNNDSFYMEGSTVQKRTNHSGGILGGMSDGSTVVLRAAIKPTPSIYQPQKTVTAERTDTEIAITGRHDPVIVPRAVVVVEAMTAITVFDLMLQNMHATYEGIQNFYRN